MIACVGLRELRELAGCVPVKFPSVHDQSAEGGPVASDELGGRVDYDIRPVLERTDRIGRAEGVVDHQRDTVTVGDLRDRVDVRDIGIRIAERLDEDHLRLLGNRLLDRFQIMHIDKGCLYAVVRKRLVQQVVAAAVDRVLCYNMISRSGQCQDRVCDCRRACCQRQRCDAPLQRRDALFQDSLRGVRQSAVDIAGISEPEPVSRVLRAVKYIGSGLIDRNRPCIGRRICLLLSYMKLQGLKFTDMFTHDNLLPLYPEACFRLLSAFSNLPAFGYLPIGLVGI